MWTSEKLFLLCFCCSWGSAEVLPTGNLVQNKMSWGTEDCHWKLQPCGEFSLSHAPLQQIAVERCCSDVIALSISLPHPHTTVGGQGNTWNDNVTSYVSLTTLYGGAGMGLASSATTVCSSSCLDLPLFGNCAGCYDWSKYPFSCNSFLKNGRRKRWWDLNEWSLCFLRSWILRFVCAPVEWRVALS